MQELNKALIVDSETTGLPKREWNYLTDFDLFPWVVSIAWIFNGVEKHYIIKPNRFVIPDEAIAIHGITNEQALAEGRPFLEVVNEFIDDARRAKFIIGQNIYFDTSIIKANVLKYKLHDLVEPLNAAIDKHKRIDVMRKTIKFVGAKQKDSNRAKFPSLQELYQKCTGKTFVAHNALNDCQALLECLPIIIAEGLIELVVKEPKPIEENPNQNKIDFHDPEPIQPLQETVERKKVTAADVSTEKPRGIKTKTIGVMPDFTKQELTVGDYSKAVPPGDSGDFRDYGDSTNELLGSNVDDF